MLLMKKAVYFYKVYNCPHKQIVFLRHQFPKE